MIRLVSRTICFAGLPELSFMAISHAAQVNLQLILATLVSYEVSETNHVKEHVAWNMAFPPATLSFSSVYSH